MKQVEADDFIKIKCVMKQSVCECKASYLPQVRMFMKTWAFVRSNLTHARSYKKNDDAQTKSLCPDFSHYLFFLFAPTLVYRDQYPR